MRISQKHLHTCYTDRDVSKYSLKDNHNVKSEYGGGECLGKRKCKDLCLCLQDVSGVAL